MVAYTYRMPAGIPGDVNRAFVANVLTEVITPAGSAGAPVTFGIPVLIDAGTGQVRQVVATDTTPNIEGFLVRPFPSYSVSVNTQLGVSTPPANGPCDVMVKGCMSVLLAGNASATKGGQVYVWFAASAGNHVQGAIEAAITAGSSVAIPGCVFRGPADANGITEIMFNE